MRDGEKERDVRKREMEKRVEKEKEEREGFREPNGNQAMVKGRKPSSGGEEADRRQACPEVEATPVGEGSQDTPFSGPPPGPVAVAGMSGLARRLDCPQGRHGEGVDAAA